MLKLRGVGHSYEAGRPILENIDFEFATGALNTIVGPSGSGKSTLLAIAAGFLAPSVGTVERLYEGSEVLTVQGALGTPERSTLDHVMLPLLHRGNGLGQAASEALTLLDRVGLRAHASQRFSTLSGGQAQRLMLARALAARPAVLLLDEPTAQLDRASARGVITHLKHLTDLGVIIVAATHDQALVTVSDRVLDVDGGDR